MPRALLAVVCLALAGCVIPELDGVGKRCPCDPALFCDPGTQRCVASIAQDASPTLDMKGSCGNVTYADATPGNVPNLTCEIQRANSLDGMGAALFPNSTALVFAKRNVGGCISVTLENDHAVSSIDLLVNAVDTQCGAPKCGGCGVPNLTLFYVPPGGNPDDIVVVGTFPRPDSTEPTPYALAGSPVIHAAVLCRAGTTQGQQVPSVDYLGLSCN